MTITTTLQILLSGIVLGFSIAAPPGPINAMAAQQIGMRKSWLAGWLTELGASTADGIFFVLTYYGLASIVTPTVRRSLFVVGGALMLYFAYATLRKAHQQKDVLDEPVPLSQGLNKSGLRSKFPYLLGLSIGLTNPYQLGWWITLGAGMVSDYGVSIIIGFFTGIIAWTLVFTTMVNAGVSRYRHLSRPIAYVSGVIMAAFGIWFLGYGILTFPFP